MVREIIHVQLGQCGNNIGNEFWYMMGKEHNLSADGKFQGNSEQKESQLKLDKIDVYYYQKASTMRFTPRAVLVDLDPFTIETTKASSLGSLFKPDNMCFGSSECSGAFAWAQGHYLEGAELIDELVDIIRRETEECDCPQGFQLTHSIGSGTGGGMGTLLLLKIRDNYPSKMTSTFSVFPSLSVSDIGLEAYHATLSIHQLLENSDLTFLFDNEALYSIAHNILKQNKPKYYDFNWIIANAMSGITAPFRFKCELNGDIRTMGMNLVPFPRLKFFLISQAPLFRKGRLWKCNNMNVQQVHNALWNCDNWLANIDDSGKYLSACCVYRGQKTINDDTVDYYSRYIDPKFIMDAFIKDIQNKTYQSIPRSILNLCGRYIPCDGCEYKAEYKKSMYEFEYEINRTRLQMKNDRRLVMWIKPRAITCAKIEVPMYANDDTNMDIECVSSSATMIANSTGITPVFQRISDQFVKMYKRKAFLHHQKGEGMDEMEFQEADKNVRDLIIDYQDREDCMASGYCSGCDNWSHCDCEYSTDDEESEDEEDYSTDQTL